MFVCDSYCYVFVRVGMFVCVCVCVRVHVLRLVLVHAGGVAYGCKVGWALLCTPGVKWTV